MPDAVKLGFIPVSAAAKPAALRGVLVVYCDDTLKLGPAARKAVGGAADQI
jgi:leucyl aminopeptidase